MNQAHRSKLKRLSTIACTGALAIGLAGCFGGGGIGNLIPEIPIGGLKYAAIAFPVGVSGGWAAVQGHDSASEAESEVLNNCRNRFEVRCVLAFDAFANCGAIAVGRGGRGAGSAPTRQGAINTALNECRKYATGCRIDTGASGREAIFGATC